MKTLLLTGGLALNLGFIGVLVWSILFPQRRVWPLQKVSAASFLLIWLPTIGVCVSGFALGFLDWNGLGWPPVVRWGLGLPLLIIGNVIVWRAVSGIGIAATSGAPAELRTNGFYRVSRNPQYMADLAIIVGWTVLSASAWVIPISIGTAIAFILAPFAEEPWLRRTYGHPYDAYRRCTSRFIDFRQVHGTAMPTTKSYGD